MYGNQLALAEARPIEAAVSPDGRLVLVLVTLPYPTVLSGHNYHSDLWILDSETGERIRTIKLEREQMHQAPSLCRPDKLWLPDGGVVCWRAEAGGTLYRLDPWTGEETPMSADSLPNRDLGVSPDGLYRRGLSSGTIVDIATGQVLAQIPDGWEFDSWTGCADPMVSAKQVRSKHSKPELRLLLGPHESRHVTLPVPGKLQFLRDGEFLLEAAPLLAVVNNDGELLRTLYEPQGVAR